MQAHQSIVADRPISGPGPSPGSEGSARSVLLLLEDLGGGTGNHVCKMAARWSAAGWTVTIVTQTAPVVHQLPSGVDVRVMQKAGWYDRFPIAQVRRLLELRRVIRRLRPD